MKTNLFYLFVIINLFIGCISSTQKHTSGDGIKEDVVDGSLQNAEIDHILTNPYDDPSYVKNKLKFIGSIPIAPESCKNLLANGGLEMNGIPSWTYSQNSLNLGVVAIKTEGCFSGSQCFGVNPEADPKNDYYRGLYQSGLTLLPGKRYYFSAKYKTTINGSAFIYLSNSSVGINLGNGAMNGFDKWHTIWNYIRVPLSYNGTPITNSDNWTLYLQGHLAQDELLYDEVTLCEVDEEPDSLSAVGAMNNDDSKSVDFGNASAEENASQNGIKFSLVEFNTSLNDYVDSPDQTFESDNDDLEFTYRKLLPEKSLKITFPEFNTNSDGLPLSEMVLEIGFKDTMSTLTAADPNKKKDKRILIKVRNEYEKWHNYFDIAKIGGRADGSYRVEQHGFDVTPYPLLRAIGGKFTFILSNMKPSSPMEMETVPIDYITLRKISPDDYYKLTSKQNRVKFGLYEAPEIEDSPSEPIDYQNDSIVLFLRDPMKPVYQHTKPKSDELSDTVVAYSAPGEIESLTFAIYSKNGISDLTFLASDLKTGVSSHIPKKNIKLYEVANSYQIFSPYTMTFSYSYLPDYLMPVEKTSLSEDSSKMFFIDIEIPKKAKGGLYVGTIDISSPSGGSTSLKINLHILSKPLMDSKVIQFMQDDPYINMGGYLPWNKDNHLDGFFKLFKRMGAEPHIVETHSDFELVVDDNNEITDIKTDEFEKKIDEMIKNGVLKKNAVLYIWEIRKDILQHYFPELNNISLYEDYDLWNHLSDPMVEKSFETFSKKILNIAQKKKIKLMLTLEDEVCAGISQRILFYKVGSIFKALGGETYAAYFSICDLEVDSYPFITPNGTVPALTEVTDYKAFTQPNMDEGFDKGYEKFGYYTINTATLYSPIYSRFNQGLLAFATGADIVTINNLAAISGDPYNQLDTRLDIGWHEPDFTLVYPTWNSNVIFERMAFLGAREGIKDSKYISTLENMIKHVKMGKDRKKIKKAIEAENYLKEIKSKIKPHFFSEYYQKSTAFGYSGIILSDLSSGNSNHYEIFSEIRNTIWNYIRML